jgi:hypothetical protein
MSTMRGTSGPHHFGTHKVSSIVRCGVRKSMINNSCELTCISDSRQHAAERWTNICLDADRAVDEL